MKNESEKIKISCTICEEAVVAGTANSDPSIRAHLAGCPSCREFADFQKDLLALEPVIKGNIPEFAEIKRISYKRKDRTRKMLRLVVIPMSIAAAVALCIGTVLFDVQLTTVSYEPSQQPNSQHYTAAAASPAAPDEIEPVNIWPVEDDMFAAALEENSVTLTWDQPFTGVQICKNSMQDARNGEQWSIEVFNPYSEDMIW